MSAHSEKTHIIPVKTYLAIGGLLMALTIVTVLVSFINLGGFNIVVALAIASVKALLVAFFFMHLYYDNKTYLIIFTIGLIFLTIFLSLTMFDTLRRDVVDPIEAQTIRKDAIIYQQEK